MSWVVEGVLLNSGLRVVVVVWVPLVVDDAVPLGA